MKIRGIAYITLLAILIVARFYLMLRLPRGEIFDWLCYSGLLFDLIFFGILTALLQLLQERRWLTALAWITLIACIIRDPLGMISDEYLSLSPRQFSLYTEILTVPAALLTIGLFFARRGPAQYCFRWLAVIMLGAWLFLIPEVAIKFSPKAQLIIGLSAFALEYTILMNIVFKTPALTSAYDITFP